MTNLIQTFTLAAAKAVDTKSAKLAREAVEVGTHTVDFLLRIRGTFKVGEDYEQRLVATAEIKTVKAQAAKAVEALKAPTMSVCKGKVTTELDFEIIEEVN